MTTFLRLNQKHGKVWEIKSPAIYTPCNVTYIRWKKCHIPFNQVYEQTILTMRKRKKFHLRDMNLYMLLQIIHNSYIAQQCSSRNIWWRLYCPLRDIYTWAMIHHLDAYTWPMLLAHNTVLAFFLLRSASTNHWNISQWYESLYDIDSPRLCSWKNNKKYQVSIQQNVETSIQIMEDSEWEEQVFE